MERRAVGSSTSDGGDSLEDLSGLLDGRIARVTVDVVRPLRHAVLRPGKPWDSAHYPGDDNPASAHFAVTGRLSEAEGTNVFSVGTILSELPNWLETDEPVWRIRGMATRSDARSSGLGSVVLTNLLTYAESAGGGVIWCTARTGALPFYERQGFVPRGELHRVPGLGPHQTMWRQK